MDDFKRKTQYILFIPSGEMFLKILLVKMAIGLTILSNNPFYFNLVKYKKWIIQFVWFIALKHIFLILLLFKWSLSLTILTNNPIYYNVRKNKINQISMEDTTKNYQELPRTTFSLFQKWKVKFVWILMKLIGTLKLQR